MSKYNKKYFEKLDKLVLEESKKDNKDKTIEFIPLTSDVMFKSIMRQNPDVFKDLLINTMDIKIDDNENCLLFLDKELIKGNIKEKGKIVDFNVSIGKGLLINVEVNRMEYKNIKYRNDLFFEKLDTMQFEIGDNYNIFKYKKLYQLNLNASSKERKDINKRMIVEYDILNKEVVDDRRIKFTINLANYYDMYYNKSVEMTTNEIFLAGLMSKNFAEMYEIMSIVLEDSKLDKFMESVINMCKEMESIHEWQKEKMDELVKSTMYENGVEDGIEKGIEQNTIITIKKMLENNIDIKTISKISGRSLEYIQNIENTLTN